MRPRESVHRGIRSLRQFSGRDSRGAFWPYAGLVLGVTYAVGGLLSFVVVAVGIVAAPSSAIGLMAPMLLLMSAMVATVVVLLAAAVTRRLHDRGRRGVWALLPLGALLTALCMMIPVGAAAERDDGPGILFAAMGVGLLYFALLAALVLQLVLPGRAQGDRFAVSRREWTQRGTERQT